MRTRVGPRKLDEVSKECIGVGTRRAEGDATGCATATGGTRRGVATTGARTGGGNSLGYASRRVTPTGNRAMTLRITDPPITQGVSSAQSRVVKRIRALWASSLKACSSTLH